MHALNTDDLSFDSNTIVDFHLTDNLALLDNLFSGRAHMSDFVEAELADADIKWDGPQVVKLSTVSELRLFEDIRKNNPPLGRGEVGAITVAMIRQMAFISNDRAARQVAKELGLQVFGSLAILKYAVESGALCPGAAVNMLEQFISEGGYFSEGLFNAFKRDMVKKH